MTEYEELSETELQKVIQNAEKALKEKQASKRKEVIAKINELAASIGVTVDIREEKEKPARKGKKVAPKYRNPNDPSQTWTGRGVAPKWMQALLNSGRDKSEFLI
ncbi:H-NS histone family protein [Methylomarinum sp. Ch1-1]|uniref:H-NS histone family protein n=1 Tax=Methylomarinum roseum TaxID=3067653 RepID=A0AAU7NT08_9GAMM|nr:H-NS histone family protein [Methylomarinum sp. Ch1-1]MDP4519890.1 H-NS histone family protein [Methylomarinum sp. Ch1-1]